MLTLPEEIQEKIIDYFTGWPLYYVAEVCLLWRDIVQRRCYKLCKRLIPDDILYEIISTLPSENCKVNHNEESKTVGETGNQKIDSDQIQWIEVYRRWLQSQLPTRRITHPVWKMSKHSFNLSFNARCIYSENGILFLADAEGQLTIVYRNYYPDGSCTTIRENVIYLHDGKINSIQLINRHNVVVVNGQETHFILVNQNGDEEPVKLMCTEEMTGRRDVSIDGNKMAAFKDVFNRTCISIFEVIRVDGIWLRLDHIIDIDCSSDIYKFNLWSIYLSCFLSCGEVCLWKLNFNTEKTDEKSVVIDKRDTIAEIKYENPIWFFRGQAFVSTQVQRQMLYYWHMDRGVNHWLEGLPHGKTRRVYPPFNSHVTCLTARRSIMAAGTENGQIILYRSSDGSIDNDVLYGSSSDKRIENDSTCLSLRNEVWHTLHLGFNAIEYVALDFTDYYVIIHYVTSAKCVESVYVNNDR